MSIQALIDDLATRGVRLTLNKGQIEANGPKGATSADMVRRIRSNRIGLAAFLTNALLERAAEAVPGVTPADLRVNLDAKDWEDSDLIAFEPLKALAHCIRNTRDLKARRVPKGWDAITECAVCGPVPIFPGGSKAVLGCPWCLAGVLAP